MKRKQNMNNLAFIQTRNVLHMSDNHFQPLLLQMLSNFPKNIMELKDKIKIMKDKCSGSELNKSIAIIHSIYNIYTTKNSSLECRIFLDKIVGLEIEKLNELNHNIFLSIAGIYIPNVIIMLNITDSIINFIKNIKEKIALKATDKSLYWNNKYPIHYAVCYNNAEVFSAILDHTKNPDELLDSIGNTALQYCIITGNIQFALMLIEKGANTKTINYDGHSLLHSFAYSKNKSITLLNFILTYTRSFINRIDNKGNTAINIIMQSRNLNNLPYIEILVENGASLQIPNSEGILPLDNFVDFYSAEFTMLINNHIDFKMPVQRKNISPNKSYFYLLLDHAHKYHSNKNYVLALLTCALNTTKKQFPAILKLKEKYSELYFILLFIETNKLSDFHYNKWNCWDILKTITSMKDKFDKKSIYSGAMLGFEYIFYYCSNKHVYIANIFEYYFSNILPNITKEDLQIALKLRLVCKDFGRTNWELTEDKIKNHKEIFLHNYALHEFFKSCFSNHEVYCFMMGPFIEMMKRDYRIAKQLDEYIPNQNLMGIFKDVHLNSIKSDWCFKTKPSDQIQHFKAS